MAVRDIKEYFYKIQDQYLEMKADLADFDQALKDGHITEDQLQAAKDEVLVIEQNYTRLAYVLYLLELPNRKSKQARYNKQNENVVIYMQKYSADVDSVIRENDSALAQIRAEIKKLKKPE